VTSEQDGVDVLGAKTLDSYQFTNYWLCLESLFSCCVVPVKISCSYLYTRVIYVDFLKFL
jgi:hypothetical protein